MAAGGSGVAGLAAGPDRSQREAMIRRWFTEDHSTAGQHWWGEDKRVVDWLVGQVNTAERSTSQDSIKLLRRDAVLNSLKCVEPELMQDIGG